MKLGLLVIGLLINLLCFSQANSLKNKEVQLVKLYNDVYLHPGDNQIEKLDDVISKLCALLISDGAMQYPFTCLKKETGISVYAAADNKVRFFSWGDPPGGWGQINCIQYIDGRGNLRSVGEGQAGYPDFDFNVDSIIPLSANSYLLLGWAHCGFDCGNYCIGNLQIKDGGLDTEKKIFQLDKEYDSSINLHFEGDDAGKVSRGYNVNKRQLCFKNHNGPNGCLTYDGEYFKKAIK